MSDTEHLGFWPTINTIYHDRYRCSGMMAFMVRIEGTLDPGLLRRALFVLQQRHPLLQSVITDDNRYYRFTREAYTAKTDEERLSSLPLRIVRKQAGSSCQEVLEQELCRNFEQSRACLWRAVLLDGLDSGTHEIILVFHHAIADALCGAWFVAELLVFCSGYADRHRKSAQRDTLPLLPAVEKMIPKRADSPRPHRPDVVLDAESAPWMYERHVVLEKRKVRLLFRRIDGDTVSMLKQRAEKEATTINSILSAALLLSAAQTKNVPCRFLFSTAIDLRKYCEPPVGHEHFGCHIMMLQTEPVIQPETDLWELARQCGSILSDEVAAKQLQGFLPGNFTKALLSAVMINNMAQADKEHRFSGGPALSNLGVLDLPCNWGPFRLDEIYFTTCQISGLYMLFVSVLNFNGELFCCFSFAEPLISRETAAAIAGRFSAMLKSA